jgi:pSer/pThr/pTyr-binding forkhead associated (FHA) protein
MQAQLIPIDGGTPIELTKDLTLVGRKECCDVRLDHKSVSKVHCVLTKSDGLLFLRDLGSTNGTKVNGKRVRRAALNPNDVLYVAGFNFRVVIGNGALKAAPHDATQHFNAEDVKHLLAERQAAEKPPPELQVKVNPLPDAYPDEEVKPAGKDD